MLKHLIIYPNGGLGNKFRVIFSGLRVSEKYKIPLDILFLEGGLHRLIQLPPHVRVIREKPDLTGYTSFKTDEKHRIVDFSKMEKVFCSGFNRFQDASQRGFNIYQYANYIKPSDEVLEREKQLKARLQLPDDYISMHIRRGDHQKCIKAVPDTLVLEKIDSTLASNPASIILIACEDVPFREQLKSLYGDRVTIASSKTEHWVGGSRLSLETAINDYAELMLLSRGLYVIGTGHSSYSRLIISYNRNRRCTIMGKNASLDV